MSWRSLRTEYSICTSKARSSCSGGIDGRPVFGYSRANSGESSRSAVSTIVRIARRGWSAGTRCSGAT